MKGTLFLLCAPSGGGKTSLARAVIKKAINRPLTQIVTYTTRPARPGEKEGEDYHFVSPEVFELMVQKGMFLEWSNVYGSSYGSPISIKKGMEEGNSYILLVDCKGVNTILSLIPDAVAIWIETPLLLLEERLIKRNSESPEQIVRRLTLAAQERETAAKIPFQYRLINEGFEKAVEELLQFLNLFLKKV